MSFRELDIKKSYKSKGDNNIVDSFLVPTLKQTIIYKRSVGFFSSSSLGLITDGLVELYRNGGKIQLMVSPNLSEEDQQAIMLGYDKREQLLKECFSVEFERKIEELEDYKLELLCDLIAHGVLEIKIVVTEDGGMYHDKLGILTDKDSNKIVFYGSSNSSMGGYKTNYEKIRVTKSWDENSEEIISDEEDEFDSIWNGENEFVNTYEYTEAAKASIMKTIEKKNSGNSSGKGIVLRDYQNEAIDAWVKNQYRGFFVMATGTGKTWTAIYATKKLLETKEASVVICAPYKHLIKQWGSDLEKVFKDAKIILVSSENPDYNKEIVNAAVDRKIGNSKQIIIISTIASFGSDKFNEAIKKIDGEKMLIVDEAHRFTRRDESLKEEYKYMLGLSATPITGKSIDSGNELLDFFGGKVFDLPIEKALERGFLVPYKYIPIFVSATEDEENRFNKQSKMMASCYRNNVLINKDLFNRCYRNRLRVIGMAEEKQKQLPMFCEMIEEKDHVVVYCGDGKLFDDDRDEERKHIDFVKGILNKAGYKTHQFTAEENMNERMQLVDDFNNANLTALAAIRCLDEGINIPSIKSALILSSNDDYREFIQRRGRILRLYENKKEAMIYDIIVLPSKETKKWAEIELRRYFEYGHLSLNWNSIKDKFFELVDEYKLELSDINLYNEIDLEDERDE